MRTLISRNTLWLLVLLFACSHAYGQASAPQHALGRDGKYVDPDSIWRYAARSAAIPINKPYGELTQEERSLISRAYPHLSPGDEPPFPKRGLESVINPLIQAQDRLLASGKLRLTVSVDANGQAQSVRPEGTPNRRMIEFASKLMLLIEYKPALCAGQPCAMDYYFAIQFKRE